MSRRDLVYVVGLFVVAALLLANLLRPTAPGAYDLPEGGGPDVAISAVGNSAWAIVGNRVYFVSFKTRAEIEDRIIYVIDDEELK